MPHENLEEREERQRPLDQIQQLISALTWQKWMMLVSFFVIAQLMPALVERINPGGSKTEAGGHFTGSALSVGVGYYARKFIGG